MSSGFVSVAESPTAPVTVKNTAFYPDVALADVRTTMRLDGTVTDARLQHTLVDAIVQTNQELREWKATQLALGFHTLADVPAEQTNNESVLLALYRRAVYSFTAANLIERLRNVDTTNEGHDRADQLESPIDDLRRDARWAIRDLLGRHRNTVELI